MREIVLQKFGTNKYIQPSQTSHNHESLGSEIELGLASREIVEVIKKSKPIMTNFIRLTFLAISLFVVTGAQGQALTNTFNFTVTSSNVPDGNPVGIANSGTISGVAGYITNIQVKLNITGGFNGDLYAYLAGPLGGFAVLLNRSGLTAGNPFGYADTGFNITLEDGNSNIHG